MPIFLHGTEQPVSSVNQDRQRTLRIMSTAFTPPNKSPLSILRSIIQKFGFRRSFLIENIGQVATTAVLSVVHGGHEDTGTAVLGGALATKALDLAVTVDLVVLEHGQLGLLALVLDLLGGGVDLLLALLATATETEDEMQGRLLLDVVVGEGAAVLELLAGEDQSLLVRGDTLLV